MGIHWNAGTFVQAIIAGENAQRTDATLSGDDSAGTPEHNLDANASPRTVGAGRGEDGAISLTVIAAVAAAAVAVGAVVLYWHILVGLAVGAFAYRHLTRATRRRRPKSSWSQMGRTVAMMYGAWNTRWLKNTTFRASVPAAAGAGAMDVHGVSLDPSARLVDDIPF